MIVPVIIAGGYGERLWPLSTREVPKPFALRDVRGRSLFQSTLLRVVGREQFTAPVVVCNRAHRLLVIEQLREVGVEHATIILEPEARNTAPAIALAALLCDTSWPDASMLVMPADHQIDEPHMLLAALKQAEFATQGGHIVTFAVEPTAAETGYGYIQRGTPMKGHEKICAIERFIEKPEREVAERLVQSGEYGWNSGLFMMKASVVLKEYEQLAPDMLLACADAYTASKRDEDCLEVDVHAFSRIRGGAFDRVIMERTKRGAVMNVAMGWRDLGSWDALHEVAIKDAHGNAVTGDAVLKDVRGCHIYTDGMPVHAIGLENMLVVAAHGQLMVAPQQRANEAMLAHQEASAVLAREDVKQRPWGCFQVVETGAHYQVKQLTVRPRGKISLQRHTKRSEH